MATSMEKKIAKLEVGLLHLQPNIDIPESMLVVHPTVAQVIKRCCDDRVKVKVADFGDKVEDLTFLITLQNQVQYKKSKELPKCTGLFLLDKPIEYLSDYPNVLRISITIVIKYFFPLKNIFFFEF